MERRNVVVLAPVGEAFIVNAFGYVARRSGFNVRFHRGDALLRLLRQSRLDNSREVLTSDLLIKPVKRDESCDVYQLFIE